MSKKLLVSKNTAIIQLIYGQLTRAVSIYAQSEEMEYTEKKDIPLSKGKSDIKISYVSGVALHLAKSHNSQPFLIASSISSYLSASWSGDLVVKVLPPGLIYIQVSDLVLAVWLQYFIDRHSKEIDLGSLNRVVTSEPSELFSLQYVHARCCSLLRLAQQEKLIDCNEFSSESIPWLDTHARLRLNHQAERCLIGSLVKLVDELEPAITRPVKWQRPALDLVRAFESFWSACRICGDVNSTAPELAIARIGLVMATRSVLKFLLEEKLGISACWEL
ncbi:DALR anticodon-binding domain-containing protein [Rivularia sp. UHCC 0363]|uniref:DALR anticodon-binding domain-containing protein n=1 Tax=Rivularia sp. UHCC 0363 TaxID=3110244 RepID=UPI002B1F9DAB|nr:DALR anticodon-binding domain-containing protein [Rivularia sp. UHCC 0363]MEA5597082.1 DALR anticodon-binding domain-containing protein [Rivularia sp. UHCC 0363]